MADARSYLTMAKEELMKLPASRFRSLAFTRLEECEMWTMRAEEVDRPPTGVPYESKEETG
jgi:hypothetical protein